MAASTVLRRIVGLLLLAGSLSTLQVGTGSASSPLHSLVDDYNDGLLDSNKWLAGSGVLEQAGALRIPPNTSSNAAYLQLKSKSTYSLVGSYSAVEVLRVPSGSASEVWLDVQQSGDPYTKLSIVYTGGVLLFRETIAGRTDNTSVQYSATEHRRWRIRESAGVTFWETSSDGTKWTVRKQKTTAPFVTSVSVAIRAGSYAAVSSPGDTVVDNFNLAPPGTVQTTTTVAPVTTTTAPPTTTTTAPTTSTTTPAARPSGPLTRSTGNPIVRNGPESFDTLKAGPRAVLRESATSYRMWYEAVGTSVTQIAYATSSDGVSWTKRGVVPSLAPSLPWEMEETSPGTILYEGGVYKLWYHAGGYIRNGVRLGNARIGYATSTDGVNWTKGSSPVLQLGSSGAFDDNQTAEPRVIRLRGGGYRMYYTGFNLSSKKTSLGMATSSDGLNWSKYSSNPVINSGGWGNAWGGAIIVDEAGWHMWHSVESVGIYYKWSTDGLVWTNGPSNPVLTQNSDRTSPDGQFLGDSLSGYFDGTRYRIMYTGFTMNLYGTQGRFEGICMALTSAVR
jgi:hypothetical protein